MKKQLRMRPPAFIAVLLLISSVSGAESLRNPGFEAGLQCYSNWVWSKSCPSCEYKGTYDFFLSDDARSGRYALEIRCVGNDCGWPGKASISAFGTKGEPGAPYRITVSAKCQGSGFIYLPSTSQGETTKNLVCDGTWEENSLEFTSRETGQIGFAVYNTGTSSLFIDDIKLERVGAAAVPYSPQHAGYRNARTERTMVVDDSPYLALGFFAVPFDDLAAARDSGANTVMGIGGVTAFDCYASQGYLDRAYGLGIGVLPDSTFTARLDRPEVYENFIEDHTNHKAIVGWFLADEPDQSGVSWYYIRPETMISSYQSFKKKSSLPVISDMQRTWEADAVSIMRDYAPSMDIWMAEPYGTDFSGLKRAVRVMKGAADKPVWLAQDDIEPGLIVPKAYYAVIQNVTGIIYFDWSAFKSNPPKLEAAKRAFEELSSLKGPIMEGIDTAIAVEGVEYMAKTHGDALHILAVNPEAAQKTASFSSDGLRGTVEVLFENRTIEADGSFTDTFQGKARHVYVLRGCVPVDLAMLQSMVGHWQKGETSIKGLMEVIRRWKRGC